jgi:hypothetical protein
MTGVFHLRIWRAFNDLLHGQPRRVHIPLQFVGPEEVCVQRDRVPPPLVQMDGGVPAIGWSWYAQNRATLSQARWHLLIFGYAVARMRLTKARQHTMTFDRIGCAFIL